MAILQVENITKYYGEYLLFDDLSFVVNRGERIALVAKNGMGKTTLIKIILGKDTIESGRVLFEPNVSVGYLDQNTDLESSFTVYEEVYSSNQDVLSAMSSYEQALTTEDEKEIQKATDKMDSTDAWNYEAQVNLIITKLELPAKQRISELSGGQRKRVALAKILMLAPDLLILDEPTNHLDIAIIEWLEEYLKKIKSTLFLVTHDRYFLDNVCDTILELDNKSMYRYTGNYSYYLEKKQERLQVQTAEVAKAKNLMRKELDWMRRQPQARGTKAKYRIDAFYDLKEKAETQVDADDMMIINVAGQYLGNKVVDLRSINKSYGEKNILSKVSYSFHKGERVGIIGENGCGKSTLLNIITQQLAPDSGTVDWGDTLSIGYYKQDGLLGCDGKHVIDVIKDISDKIELEKGHTISAAQFLEQWNFPRSVQYLYVSKLSGGEKKRLYLMTVLMQKPNFLILDEPTNDLDLYTIQMLEEYLLNFKGCVLVVSHDRFFIDKVAEHLLVFKGDGEVKEFPGNYSVFRESEEKRKAELEKTKEIKEKIVDKPEPRKKKGLSFKEQQLFKQIEKEISDLEQEKKELELYLSSGALEQKELMEKSNRIGTVISLLDEKELIWLELSEKM
ncbi:MAG: ABC-F family ATP-binding cassette domain-containing protein [Bacteroidales bacterium]|nr:ABC-F family ATP-binding cassette domain-containing protein [Bacteroidales bacterium]